MHEVVEKVHKAADVLREEAVPSDRLGKLTDRTVEAMKETGLVRLLQPVEHGGHEATLADFLEAAMAVGAAAPSAGWVAGVVGVHPWEIAMMDPRLQQEIWGEDQDTWTASPYAPFGRARRVDGGFLFTGQWPYSTGTERPNPPSSASELDSPEFKAQVKALPGLDVMAANSANAKQARPTVTGYVGLSEAIGSSISQVLQGKGTPADALKKAASKADEALSEG